MWAGGFTMLFGILYGEIFGMHVLGDILFGGSPPMHKGLQPVYSKYSQTWLMLSVLLCSVCSTSPSATSSASSTT